MVRAATLTAVRASISTPVLPRVCTVVDLFSGTSRVGHAFKRAGYRVLANDHNSYAAVLARCYVQADREEVLAEARRLLVELNALPGRPSMWSSGTRTSL